jgi:haloalkane dehalogenase
MLIAALLKSQVKSVVCRTWPNQMEVTLRGLHFIQEDSPIEIDQAVAKFIDSL